MAVRHRVAALPRTAQELLEIASVAGGVVQPELLSEVTTEAEEDVLGALEAGRGAGLLTYEEGEWRFVHDLVRETIELDMSAGRRRFWHGRIGHALARLPAHRRERRAAEIAWHLGEGDDLGQALVWAMRAADAAAAAFGHAVGGRHYRSADELAEALGGERAEAEAAGSWAMGSSE